MDKVTYWRALNDEQRAQVAKELNHSKLYLSHVFLYGRRPSHKLALQIHEMTKGKVSASEFRDDLPSHLFRKRIPAA